MGAAGGLGPHHRQGRVTGLGPHERRLRRGFQPREDRNGFKGPQQTNPCYLAGTPLQATSLACLLGLALRAGRGPLAHPAPLRRQAARWGRPRCPPHLRKAGRPSHTWEMSDALLENTDEIVAWGAGVGIGESRCWQEDRALHEEKQRWGQQRIRVKKTHERAPHISCRAFSRLEGVLSLGAPGPRPRPEEHVAICQDLAGFPYEGRRRLGSAECRSLSGGRALPRPGWIWPHLHSRC